MTNNEADTPFETLELDTELAELLEQVREHVGLDSLDQAAEYLVRRRLREGTRAYTGRGRALHLVGGKPFENTAPPAKRVPLLHEDRDD